MTQTAYAEMTPGAAGMLADARALSGCEKISAIAEGAIKPGTLVMWADKTAGTVQDPPAFETAVLDADGLIATPVAMAATPTTITTFGGAVGVLMPLKYGYHVTIALNSHADWNATHLRLTGREAVTGKVVTETMDIPDAGNVTLTSELAYDRVDSIVVEAQAGTNASLTAGVLAPSAVSKSAVAGIAVRKAVHEPISSVMAFADGDVLSVLRKGAIYCEIEQDLSDDGKLYARVTAAGAEVPGAFRADTDSGDGVLLPSSFHVLADADFSEFPLAKIELSLP